MFIKVGIRIVVFETTKNEERKMQIITVNKWCTDKTDKKKYVGTHQSLKS